MERSGFTPALILSLVLHGVILCIAQMATHNDEAAMYARPFPVYPTIVRHYEMQIPDGAENAADIEADSLPAVAPGVVPPGVSYDEQHEVLHDVSLNPTESVSQSPYLQRADTGGLVERSIDALPESNDENPVDGLAVPAVPPAVSDVGDVSGAVHAAGAEPPYPLPVSSIGPYAAVETRIRELIENRKKYPEGARRRGIEGEVELVLNIEGDGRLASCEVLKASGSRILDRDAHALVRSIFPIETVALESSFSTHVKISYSLQ